MRAQVPAAIVLEDDLLVSVDFYDYFRYGGALCRTGAEVPHVRRRAVMHVTAPAVAMLCRRADRWAMKSIQESKELQDRVFTV